MSEKRNISRFFRCAHTFTSYNQATASQSPNVACPTKTCQTQGPTGWCEVSPLIHTVDGSEIRRSPVEVGRLSHYLQVLYIQVGVWDVFHQQYQQKVSGTQHSP